MAMVAGAKKEILISIGELHISKNPTEVMKATRVASSIVVTVYDPQAALGGLVHMGLPDSRMATGNNDLPYKFVDVALPHFIESLAAKDLNKQYAVVDSIGGSQLFNFGGGSGNILNVGTRNAITTRTILSRNGLQVAKTDTGGNKPRTVQLEMDTGQVLISFPGQVGHYL